MVNLSGNIITSIDRLVLSAPNLKELNLGNNSIAELWDRSIQNLEILNLSNNQITNIENIQLNPSIKHLDLSSNWIGDFYPLARINYYEKLEHLNIQSNPGSEESFFEFHPLFEEQVDTTLLDGTFNSHCPSYPTPLRGSNTMDNTLSLGWESDNSGDFEGYDLYFGETGMMELIGNNLTTSQFDVNIDDNKRYSWQVIANYQDTSYYSGIFDFRTFPPLELPFFDGFETYYVNDRLSLVSPHWKTKDQDNYESTEDGLVVGFRRFTGNKSLKIQGNTHLFIPADNLLSGVLIISFALLVPENILRRGRHCSRSLYHHNC